MSSILQQHLRSQHGPHGDAYASGFLVALQCNPEPMVPSVWMNAVLWSAGDGAFDTAGEARSVIQALTKEWENTERSLRKGQPGLLAYLGSEGEFERFTRAFAWCCGFFDAAYLDGYDFVGTSEGDLEAIAPFEILLSAGLQRGLRGKSNTAYEALQSDALKGLFRDDLVEEVMDRLDRSLVRAFRHFRGMEPIVLQYMEDEKSNL